MDWEAIGAVGEVIGAIAVLATLIYLSVQIRQNTKSQRNTSRLETTRAFTDWYTTMMQNPELNRIWSAGHAQELERGSEEHARFYWMLAAISSRIEELHTQYLAGLIEEKIWLEYRDVMVSFLQNPLIMDWWASKTTPFTSEFRNAIREANHGKVTWKNSPNDPTQSARDDA